MLLDDERIDTWEEVEEFIIREAQKKFAADMMDVELARLRAHEFAATIVKGICSMLGGQEVYVPKMARHHREERDTQIRMNFKGNCRESARESGLSSRHIRNILALKK